MKWIKASERLPNIMSPKTIFRQASTKTVLSFNMAKDWIEDGYLNDLEWLHEVAQLDTSKPKYKGSICGSDLAEEAMDRMIEESGLFPSPEPLQPIKSKEEVSVKLGGIIQQFDEINPAGSVFDLADHLLKSFQFPTGYSREQMEEAMNYGFNQGVSMKGYCNLEEHLNSLTSK